MLIFYAFMDKTNIMKMFKIFWNKTSFLIELYKFASKMGNQ